MLLHLHFTKASYLGSTELPLQSTSTLFIYVNVYQLLMLIS